MNLGNLLGVYSLLLIFMTHGDEEPYSVNSAFFQVDLGFFDKRKRTVSCGLDSLNQIN